MPFLFLGFVCCGFCVFNFLQEAFLVLVSISSKLPSLSVDEGEVSENKQSIMTRTDHTEQNRIGTVVNDTRNFNARKKYEILTFF